LNSRAPAGAKEISDAGDSFAAPRLDLKGILPTAGAMGCHLSPLHGWEGFGWSAKPAKIPVAFTRFFDSLLGLSGLPRRSVSEGGRWRRKRPL